MLEKVKGGLSMRGGETRLTNEKPLYHWPEQTASARILPDRFTRLKEIYCKDLAYVTVDQLSRSKIHRAAGRLETAVLTETPVLLLGRLSQSLPGDR